MFVKDYLFVLLLELHLMVKEFLSQFNVSMSKTYGVDVKGASESQCF